MSGNLIGKKIIIRGNEFIAQDINAFIVMIDVLNKAILLELEKSMTSKSTTYKHAVASPRLVKDDIGVLITTGVLGCSVTCVPDEKYNPNKPMDLSWWRGGAAMITDLCVST